MSFAQFSLGAAVLESCATEDGELLQDGEHGGHDSDLDGDFDIDEDYAGVESRVTYSATLSNLKTINEDDRHKVVYEARCGMRVAAVFHDQIRAELIAEAKEGGAYAHKPTEGTEATDITAFHPDQRDWEGKGVGRPDVLKSFAKPQGFTNPEYNLGFMYFDGLLVIDHEGQPLQPFRGIPLTLSSKLEGWRAEAIRRSDPRIRHMDLLVRMPVKVEPAANGILTRQALVKINAVVGRQNRFREQAGAISWGRPTARKARDFLWSLLPQHCRDNNLALPRDLTKQERWQLLALTVGTNPAKARTVENADKGMTREQYIDGVHRRAAQLPVARGSNARRQWKNAVRNATRQAAPESPSNAPTSPRDELELAQDVTDFLQVRHSASPALDEHHQPASAALALSALGALPAIPALPALPALAVPAVPSRSPEQVCGPLILGPVNPPFPVVRPGGYLCDEYTKFF